MARSHSLRRSSSLAVAALLAPFGLAWSATAFAASLLDEPPRHLTFELAPRRDAPIDLLQPLRDAGSDRLGPVRLYSSGPWGKWRSAPWWSLEWKRDPGPSLQAVLGPRADAFVASAGLLDPVAFDTAQAAGLFTEQTPGLGDLRLGLVSQFSDGARFVERFQLLPPEFDSTGSGLRSDGFGGVFQLPPVKPVVDWRCRRRPVLVTRSGGEGERLELVRCDGSVAPFAIDKLSILARTIDAPRPGELLPDEPVDASWSARREWAPGVRVMHPRMVWALQQLADVFPGRTIVIYSGYRPLAEVHDGSGHRSLHASGRALDIAIPRVENEDVFRACAGIRGVGCGYYPHNKFVHLDVRRSDVVDAYWVDGSLPGEPAQYLTDYPGVVEAGRLVGAPLKPEGPVGSNPTSRR